MVKEKQIYSIFIKKEDDETFDINIWDEVENERCEDLEVGHIATYQEAKIILDEIIKNNIDIEFVRLKDFTI